MERKISVFDDDIYRIAQGQIFGKFNIIKTVGHDSKVKIDKHF